LIPPGSPITTGSSFSQYEIRFLLQAFEKNWTQEKQRQLLYLLNFRQIVFSLMNG
jgi:hypothetical protein